MPSLAPNTTIAGKYRLERPLGKGGMGAVWVARHLQLDVTVAIKFMTTGYADSADGRARFEREAKAAAQIKHPNVIQVHDYGVEDEQPYIVMELLAGEDLQARLKREGRLEAPRAAAVVTGMCKALRRAHEMGIVHRDLKPGNVFLVPQDEEDVVKVLDFGLAKPFGAQANQSSTRSGTLVGSPCYMSPEQVRNGKSVDHRSDLWSTAVVAYEMLTGALPFPGQNIPEVLMQICSDPIAPPSQLVPGLSPALDRFFERAFQRPPAQRFQGARELADAFAAAAGVNLASAPSPVPVARRDYEQTMRLDDSGAPAPSPAFQAATRAIAAPAPAAPATPAEAPAPANTLAPAGRSVSDLYPPAVRLHPGVARAAVGAAVVVLAALGGFMAVRRAGPAEGAAQPTAAAPPAPPRASAPPPEPAVTVEPSTEAPAPSSSASAGPIAPTATARATARPRATGAPAAGPGEKPGRFGF